MTIVILKNLSRGPMKLGGMKMDNSAIFIEPGETLEIPAAHLKEFSFNTLKNSFPDKLSIKYKAEGSSEKTEPEVKELKTEEPKSEEISENPEKTEDEKPESVSSKEEKEKSDSSEEKADKEVDESPEALEESKPRKKAKKSK